MSKKNVCYFLIFITSFVFLINRALANDSELTAEAVMNAVDNRYEGDTQKQSGRIILIDK